MREFIIICTMMAMTFFHAHGQANRSSENLEVGFGVVDITGEEAVVLDSLHVKAIFFRQGGEQALIVECDVLRIADELIDKTRKEVSAQTGIPYDRIAVAATHSHMSSEHKELLPAIVKASEKAVRDLKEVKLFSAVGQEFTMPQNRRYFMEDGSVVFNPMFLNPNIIRPAGPIDPDVGFVLLKKASTGEPIGAITNYSLHLDIVKQYGAVYQKGGAGSRKSVSADFPYWLQENLKGHFGEDFHSMFLTGACGNINHWDFSKPGPQSGHKTKSKEVGDSLYKAIKEVLPALKENKPMLAVRTRTVEVPLQSFTPEDLEWAQNVESGELSSKSEEPSERQQFLDKNRRERILWLNEQKQRGKTSKTIDIMAVQLSKTAAIVTLPGEMFVEHGLTLKNFSPYDHNLVVEMTNSNDVNYVPDKRAFKQGAYEVENSRLAPGGGEKLVGESIRLLEELYAEDQ